jgi:hypothetical protein
MEPDQHPRARAVSLRPERPVRRDLVAAVAVLATIGLVDAVTRFTSLF